MKIVETPESNDASIFVSKDKTVSWTTLIPNTYGRTQIENIIPNRPGITRYAASRIDDTLDAFEICFTKSMRKIVID